jgi:hypothetical protein
MMDRQWIDDEDSSSLSHTTHTLTHNSHTTHNGLTNQNSHESHALTQAHTDSHRLTSLNRGNDWRGKTVKCRCV